METKVLRLEGTSQKYLSQYNILLEVPSKLDLFASIEHPPFYAESKKDTSFSTGILAFVSHSIRLRIFRDYAEPIVGLFVKLCPTSENNIKIQDVQGSFIFPSTTPDGGLVPFSPNLFPCSDEAGSNIVLVGNGSSSKNVPVVENANPRAQFIADLLSIQNINANIGEDALPPRSTLRPDGGDPELVEGNQNEKPLQFFKTSSTHSQQSTSSSVDGYCSEGYLYYQSKGSWPKVPSTLSIVIRVSKTNNASLVSEPSVPVETRGSSLLKSERYFLSESFSDVKVQVGVSKFPAHKIILSEKSQYFAAMFSTQMSEALNGLVKIDDVEESLVKEVLRFIYTQKVEDLNITRAQELFLLADRYDIESLGFFCEAYLVDKLTPENAIEMYDVSHTVGKRGYLAERSKQIIMWNKSKFVSDLETFKEFSTKYPDLIFDLLKL